MLFACIAVALLWNVEAVLAQATACDALAPASYTGFTQVLAWGGNSAGQLGSALQSFVNTPRPVAFSRDMKVTKISGSFFHIAMIDSETGQAWLAGDNTYGQLGGGPAIQGAQRQLLPFPFIVDEATERPVGFGAVRRVRDVAAGFRHTCAVIDSLVTTGTARVFCAGLNSFRQLGTSAYEKMNYLVVVKNPQDAAFAAENFVEVHAGGDHTVALSISGTLWSWGSNAYGQLGDGQTGGMSAEPRRVLINETVVKACCGYHYCLALVRNNKTLYGWGSNLQKQLGQGSGDSFGIPVKVLGGVEQFSCGQAHALAVVGTVVYSWGDGTSGATGQARTISPYAVDDWFVPAPRPVPDLAKVAVASISAGAKHSLVLDTCGRVFAFGSDAFGQLGQSMFSSAANGFRSLTPVLNVAIQKRGSTAVAVFATGFSSFVTTQLR